MILRVENLSKSFKQGEQEIFALSDVSFELEEGQSLAVVGPSGSGKSTLLSLLAGLDSPSAGAISIADSPIATMTEKQLAEFRAKNVGIVFQQFHLMSYLTAQENVSLPLDILGRDEAGVKAKKVLEQVGLGDRTTHLPNQLSGGERQRVAIARAFASEPKILFADEPSGNLDTETGNRIMDLLFKLAKESGMTLILITHDSQLALRCDRQIRLVGGQLQ